MLGKLYHDYAVDNMLRSQDMDLLRFSLTLLQSWMTPIQIVNRVFGNNQVFGNIDRVFDRLRDLDEGIHILMRVSSLYI